VAAVLVAEACNIGLTPVTKASVAALTRDRLSHVDQNYVRAETIKAANANLIDYQATIPLAQVWGGGLVASADGMRFVVPVQTINAGPNPRYFGTGRGGTWFNMVNDQVAGISGVFVAGTLRDSLVLIDAMHGQDGEVPPQVIMTDTASYLVTWTPCLAFGGGGGCRGRQTRRFRRSVCGCGSVKRTARPGSSCSMMLVTRSRWSPVSCGSWRRGTARLTRSCLTPTTCGTCGGSSPVTV